MTKSAAELRAEASQMREFALTVTDPDVLAEINLMIAELERRARLLDNGGAASSGADSRDIGLQEDLAFLREGVMAPRQFTLGDHVRLALGSYSVNNPQEPYTISRMLPVEANVWQYRVKRVSDGQERAVSEPQLVKVV